MSKGNRYVKSVARLSQPCVGERTVYKLKFIRKKSATSSLPNQRSGTSQRSNPHCLQFQSPASGSQSLTEQQGPFQKEGRIPSSFYYWKVKLSQLLQTCKKKKKKQGPRAISESWPESCVLIKRKKDKCHTKSLSPNGSWSTSHSCRSDAYICVNTRRESPTSASCFPQQ